MSAQHNSEADGCESDHVKSDVIPTILSLQDSSVEQDRALKRPRLDSGTQHVPIAAVDALISLVGSETASGSMSPRAPPPPPPPPPLDIVPSITGDFVKAESLVQLLSHEEGFRNFTVHRDDLAHGVEDDPLVDVSNTAQSEQHEIEPGTGLETRDDTEVKEVINGFPGTDDRAMSAAYEAARKIQKQVQKHGMDIRVVVEVAIWMEEQSKATRDQRGLWPSIFYGNRSFWDQMSLLMAEFYMESHLAPIPTAYDPVTCVSALLSSHVVLLQRMIAVDVDQLESLAANASLEKPPICVQQLAALNMLFFEEHSWIVLVLGERRHTNLTINIATSTSVLHDLLSLQEKLMEKSLLDVGSTKFSNLLAVVNQFIINCIHLSYSRHPNHAILSGLRPNLANLLVSLFKLNHNRLYHNTRSQNDPLNREYREQALAMMVTLLYQAMDLDTRARMEIIDLVLPDPPALPEEELPVLVVSVWQIKILKTYIRQGSMELRVCGTELLSQILLELYRRFVIPSSPSLVKPRTDHRLLQSVAQVLIDENIVEHWLEAATHPQMVARLGKCIGFLVVTENLPEDKARLLWKHLLMMQDKTVKSSMFDVVLENINLLSLDQVIQLCQEITKAPLSVAPEALKMYDAIFHKFSDHETRICMEERLQESLINFCIELMCLTAAQEYSAGSQEVSQKALAAIQRYSEAMAFEVRNRIYLQWTIRLHNSPHVAPIMLALYTVLDNNRSDSDSILSEMNLLQIATDAFIEKVNNWNVSQEVYGPQSSSDVSSWLKLPLLLFVLRLPDDKKLDLTEFWSCAFGTQSLDEHSRNIAWQLLSTLFQELPEIDWPNAWTELCNTYIPLVEPQQYVDAITTFVEDCLSRAFQNDQSPDRSNSDDIRQITGLGFLWRVVLHAYNADTSSRAGLLLVRLLSDKLCIQRLTSKSAEEVHTYLARSSVSTVIDVCKQARAGKDKELCRIIRLLLQMQLSLREHQDFTEISVTDLMKIVPSNLATDCAPMNTINQIDVPYALSIKHSSPRNDVLRISRLATRNELHARIGQEFGISSFKTIIQGQQLDLLSRPYQSLQEFDIASKGRLLIIELVPEVMDLDKRHDRTLSTFEIQLQENFTDLYALLERGDELAFSIFQLLSSLAPHEATVGSLGLGINAFSDLFPDTGLKSYYSLRCMKKIIVSRGRTGQSADHGIFISLIGLLEKFVQHMHLSLQADTNALSRQIWSTVFAVLRMCTEPIDQDHVMSIKEPLKLIDKLLAVLSTYLTLELSDSAICDAYATLVKLAVTNLDSWEYLTQSGKLLDIHRNVLLRRSCTGFRRIVLDSSILAERTTAIHYCVSGLTFVQYHWNQYTDLVQDSFDDSANAAEFFEVLQELFEYLFQQADVQPSHEALVALDQKCTSWKDLMLTNFTTHAVASGESHAVVNGLTSLLTKCFSVLQKHSIISIDKLQQIGLQVWKTLLFVAETQSDVHSTTTNCTPILNSTIRSQLYALIRSIMLEGKPELFEVIAQCVESVCDTDDQEAWQVNTDQIMRPLNRPIGLKNVGYTCYLSALLTQLYMFPSFRDFLIHALPATNSRLLETTRDLFVQMQYGLEPYGHPGALVREVMSYDGASINIDEQMDVEEFFNLIFDQWEESLPSGRLKQTFRSFFGLKITYQVKSLECEHISERTEPSFNIQCDVQGKASLQESLDAYVSGDIMQVDNKYKCESCGGKFVDAVRRTCLKDIPDNLVLHLKRFEYDIHTQQRKKVNTHFEFPHTLDMRPYTFEQLSQPEKVLEADHFELVGVLIHKGQAEHGHYISCIRTRPGTQTGKAEWLLYDDSEVTPFDPRDIGDLCFGGPFDMKNKFGDGSTSYKAYSAYMLFYQRRAALDSPSSRSGKNIEQSNLPDDIKSKVKARNLQIMRNYCLFADSHGDFVAEYAKCLQNVSHSPAGHRILSSMISSLWMCVWHIHSRRKNTSYMDRLLEKLLGLTKTCERCTSIILSFLWEDVERLRDLLTRTPLGRVRDSMQHFILNSLIIVHDRITENKTTFEGRGNMEVASRTVMHNMLIALQQLGQSHLHHAPKDWYEYWNLILNIAQISTDQCKLMIRMDYLLLCLQHLNLELLSLPKSLQAYTPLASMLHEKALSHNALTNTFLSLLRHVSFYTEHTTVSSREFIDVDEPTINLIESEMRLLTFSTGEGIVWLRRIHDLWDDTRGERFAPQDIVELLLGRKLHAEFQRNVLETIRTGIASNTTVISNRFIRTAVTCLRLCSDRDHAGSILQAVTKLSDPEEKHNQGFVIQFCESISVLENFNLPSPSGMPSSFYDLVLRQIPSFVPSFLLAPQDTETQQQTMALVHGMIFQFAGISDDAFEGIAAAAAVRRETAISLGRKCLQEATVLLGRHPPIAKQMISPLINCAIACKEFLDVAVEHGDSSEHYVNAVSEYAFRSNLEDILPAYEAQEDEAEVEMTQSETSMTDYTDDDEEEPTIAAIY